MARPSHQACENCHYWQLVGPASRAAAALRPPAGTTMTYGSCLRYPPQLPGPPNLEANSYPDTLAQYWCGEWVPTNPETVEEGAAVMARLVQIGDMTAARALADKLKEGTS